MFPTQRLPVRRATRSRGHWTWVTIMFVLVSSNGRLLSSPQDNILRAREEIGRGARGRATPTPSAIQGVERLAVGACTISRPRAEHGAGVRP